MTATVWGRRGHQIENKCPLAGIYEAISTGVMRFELPAGLKAHVSNVAA